MINLQPPILDVCSQSTLSADKIRTHSSAHTRPRANNFQEVSYVICCLKLTSPCPPVLSVPPSSLFLPYYPVYTLHILPSPPHLRSYTKPILLPLHGFLVGVIRCIKLMLEDTPAVCIALLISDLCKHGSFKSQLLRNWEHVHTSLTSTPTGGHE